MRISFIGATGTVTGHVYGQRAQRAVALAREQVAALLGCDADEILFTSGGTESNNLAIRGVADAIAVRRRIVTTTIEHPATTRPCAWLGAHGWQVTQVGVDADGRARVDEARDAIDHNTALVTIMHSNNETGVLQPVGELAPHARAAGALVHTDAAQSVGKVIIDVRALDVDLLSLAGHKLYAPKGVGALYVKRGTPLSPFASGAGHERGLRPGTENVASIVGLGVACEVMGRDLVASAARMAALRTRLWECLATDIPGLAINGHLTLRLPNTLNVRFPGVLGSAVLERAPEVAASTGSACHDGHHSASPVIVAMGIAPDEALGSVRLTLGRGTTEANLVGACEALVRSWKRLAGGW